MSSEEKPLLPGGKPDLSTDVNDIPSGIPTTPIVREDIFYTNPFRGQMPTELAKRDGKFGKAGKKAVIEINSHKVTGFPTKDVFQYDVSLDLMPCSQLTPADTLERSLLDQVQRSVA